MNGKFYLTFASVWVLALVPAGAVEHEKSADAKIKHDCDLRSANDLIGMDIKNALGEDIAEVHDIVLDNNQNRVAYVIVSYGGFIGLGDTHAAVPWGALGTSNYRHLTLNMDMEQLKSAPTFDPKNLPDESDVAFHRNLHEFYGVEPYKLSDLARRRAGLEAQTQQDAQALPDNPNPTTESNQAFDWDFWVLRDDEDWSRRLSDLIGKDVRNQEGNTIAEIEDVLIEEREGHIAYALVSYGETLGFFGDLAAVPWYALGVNEEQGNYTLAATRDDLEKARIDSHEIFRLEEEAVARNVHEAFGQEPYWVVYEYVIVADAEPTPKARETAAGDEIRVSGTVESVGTFVREADGTKPDSLEQSGTRIRVRGNNGEYHTVHIAKPRTELNEQRVDIARGDQITIIGTEKEYRGYKVLEADAIMTGGETIEVSSRTVEGELRAGRLSH